MEVNVNEMISHEKKEMTLKLNPLMVGIFEKLAPAPKL